MLFVTCPPWIITFHLISSYLHSSNPISYYSKPSWSGIANAPWWHHQMKVFSALLALRAGNSPVKGQWRGALMFSLICVWTKGWVNNRGSGDLTRHRTYYDAIVMGHFVLTSECCSKVVLLLEFLVEPLCCCFLSGRDAQCLYRISNLEHVLHRIVGVDW